MYLPDGARHGVQPHLHDEVHEAPLHVPDSFKVSFSAVLRVSTWHVTRAVFLHVVIPGQEPGAPDLGEDYHFPKMQVGYTIIVNSELLPIKN